MNKILSVLFVAGVMSLVFSGCSKNEDYPHYVDVTSDFLSKVGGNNYTNGEKVIGSKRTDEVSISSDGKIKLKLDDSTCPLVETGNIESVRQVTGYKEIEVTYVITEAHIAGSEADTKVCKEYIEDYRFHHIPEKTTHISCGYTAEMVDFACDGKKDKSSFANWVISYN